MDRPLLMPPALAVLYGDVARLREERERLVVVYGADVAEALWERAKKLAVETPLSPMAALERAVLEHDAVEVARG